MTARLAAGGTCVVCAATMRAVSSWVSRCPSCDTWASNLQPTGAEIDSQTRIDGFETLRRENFRTILKLIAGMRRLDGTRLLDVGCAYGWFLDEATRLGVRATGVEPDVAVAERARAQGHDVRVGMFPDAIGERFDVIAFNDVLEHIPDARGALRAAHGLLCDGGILSLNIPTSDGLGYRLTRLLDAVGVHGPHARFWQRGLACPHVHYFPRRAIARLVGDCGFAVRSVVPVASIVREGLWQRVHTVGRLTPLSVASFAALWAAAPVLNRPGASDTILVLAQRA